MAALLGKSCLQQASQQPAEQHLQLLAAVRRQARPQDRGLSKGRY